MTNQHRKTERPSNKDLQQNPEIGASKGTIKGDGVLDDEGLDEANTFEGEVENDVRRQGGIKALVRMPALSPRTFAQMRSTRLPISAAARRENVINKMRRGSAPDRMSCATLWAKVFVLPTRAGDDQQRSADLPFGQADAVHDCGTLAVVQFFQMRRIHVAPLLCA